MTAKALILTGYGINSEEETALGFSRAGFNTVIRHINDLADNPKELGDCQVLCVPGGFSYGDDTGSGNAYAQKMRLTVWEHVLRFIERDTLTLGICNGCQILVNLGLTPPVGEAYGTRKIGVTHNASARYQCRFTDVAVQDTSTPWLSSGAILHIPVAHGEGRFMMDSETLTTLKRNRQIALRFVKPDGTPANGAFPFNPSGSTDDIAGMTDGTGRVLVLMPHAERGMFTSQRDDYALLNEKARRDGKILPEEADGFALFKNAACYFQTKRETKSART